MIASALLLGGMTFRRLLPPRQVLLAAGAGLLAGVLVFHVPAPSLAADVYRGLVATFGALVALPLLAALPAADRAGGYEQLQTARPIDSLSFTLGRLLGGVAAAAVLFLVVGLVAAAVAGTREVPHELPAQAESWPTAHEASWRFPIPAGTRGPFDLIVETLLPPTGTGRLRFDLRRGAGAVERTVSVLPARHQTLSLPDLHPERGDAYVTLHAEGGLVLGRQPPRLRVGSEPLSARGGLRPTRPTAEHLAFAALVVLAAACAFRFETACLAGLTALVFEPPPSALAFWSSLALLVLFASLGVALVRRQALP